MPKRFDRMTEAELEVDTEVRILAEFAEQGLDIDAVDPVREAGTARLLATEPERSLEA